MRHKTLSVIILLASLVATSFAQQEAQQTTATIDWSELGTVNRRFRDETIVRVVDPGGDVDDWKFDVDSVATVNATASGPGTIANGPGGTGRFIRQFEGPIELKWFGCVLDGSTDDTTEIQAAIDAAITASKPIAFRGTAFGRNINLKEGLIAHFDDFTLNTDDDSGTLVTTPSGDIATGFYTLGTTGGITITGKCTVVGTVGELATNGLVSYYARTLTDSTLGNWHCENVAYGIVIQYVTDSTLGNVTGDGFDGVQYASRSGTGGTMVSLVSCEDMTIGDIAGKNIHKPAIYFSIDGVGGDNERISVGNCNFVCDNASGEGHGLAIRSGIAIDVKSVKCIGGIAAARIRQEVADVGSYELRDIHVGSIYGEAQEDSAASLVQVVYVGHDDPSVPITKGVTIDSLSYKMAAQVTSYGLYVDQAEVHIGHLSAIGNATNTREAIHVRDDAQLTIDRVTLDDLNREGIELAGNGSIRIGKAVIGPMLSAVRQLFLASATTGRFSVDEVETVGTVNETTAHSIYAAVLSDTFPIGQLRVGEMYGTHSPTFAIRATERVSVGDLGVWNGRNNVDDVSDLATLRLPVGTQFEVGGTQGGRFETVADGATADGGITFDGSGVDYVRQFEGPVKVEWFGVSPSASDSENTTGIQAAIDAAATGGYAVEISSAVSFDSTVNNTELVPIICHEELLFSGTGDAIIYGTSVAKRPSGNIASVIRIRYSGTVGTSSGTGIRLRNVSDLRMRASVDNFDVGMHLHGDFGGVQYNDIEISRMFNNRVGLRLEAEDTDGAGATATGWVNENRISMNRVSTQSTYSTASRVVGIELISTDTTSYLNGNVFDKPAIELFNIGAGTTYCIYGEISGQATIAARDNTFREIRQEGTDKILGGVGVNRNLITTNRSDLLTSDMIETTNDVSLIDNKFEAANVDSLQELTAFGRQHYTIINDGSDKLTAPPHGAHLIITSFGFARKVDVVGPLTDDSVQITSGSRATGVMLDLTDVTLSLHRKITMDIRSKATGGRVYVRALTAPKAVTLDSATDTFTDAGHGMSNGDWVRPLDGDTPPGGAIDTLYYVVGATTDTFQLSTTSGGAAVNFSSDGTNVTYARILGDGHCSVNFTASVFGFETGGDNAQGAIRLPITFSDEVDYAFIGIRSGSASADFKRVRLLADPSSPITLVDTIEPYQQIEVAASFPLLEYDGPVANQRPEDPTGDNDYPIGLRALDYTATDSGWIWNGTNWKTIEPGIYKTTFANVGNLTYLQDGDRVQITDRDPTTHFVWDSSDTTTGDDYYVIEIGAGALTRQIRGSSSIASAATCEIGDEMSDSVTITGTTTITSFGTVPAGVIRHCEASGAFTITDSTSITCLGNANITTVAGSRFGLRSDGGGAWTMLYYSIPDVHPTLIQILAGAYNTDKAVRTVTASTDTPLATHRHCYYDATSANITVTLNTSLAVGTWFHLKKIDGSVNTVTLDPTGATEIDGSTTHVLSSQNDSATVVWDGTDWWIH